MINEVITELREWELCSNPEQNSFMYLNLESEIVQKSFTMWSLYSTTETLNI